MPLCLNVHHLLLAKSVIILQLILLILLAPSSKSECDHPLTSALSPLSWPSLSHLDSDSISFMHVDDVKHTTHASSEERHNYLHDHHHIYKRSTNQVTRETNSKEIKFYAWNRQFHLSLSPTHENQILAPGFKVVAVSGDGREREVQVNYGRLYDGRVIGEPDSYVAAHIHSPESISDQNLHPKGLITATIRINGSVIVVEPSWRHADSIKVVDGNLLKNSHTMVVYNATKLIEESQAENSPNEVGSNHPYTNKTKVCDYIKLGPDIETEQENVISSTTSQKKYEVSPRHKRNLEPQALTTEYSPRATRCSLKMVADYWFYSRMGGSDIDTTASYIIALIDRVNKIFLSTTWKDTANDPGFTNMGFLIRRILIHEEITMRQSYQQLDHYNEDKPWNHKSLLKAFSYAINHETDELRSYCLAHLLTHRNFESAAVVGFAYVAADRGGVAGGICSGPYQENGQLYPNTAFSSTLNGLGKVMTSRETDLVTAHELGHNWGAEHDPDNEECSPLAKNGGPYLMYTFAVGGLDANNKFFSPCSLRSIKAVLQSKADDCFINMNEVDTCGNGIVDGLDEECDVGFLGVKGDDNCCDLDCKLKPGADCSDKNSPCCTRCRIASSNIRCRQRTVADCKEDVYCDGYKSECPPPLPVENGTRCINKGTCINGECVSFCEAQRPDRNGIGFVSCLCEEKRDMCKRCCRKNIPGAACEPFSIYDNGRYDYESLPDGTICRKGLCEKGRCEPKMQDFVNRLWDIVEEINVSVLLKLFKANLIFVVCLFTALFWIPVSWFISYLDDEKRRQLLNRRKGYRRAPTASTSSSSRASQISALPTGYDDQEGEAPLNSKSHGRRVQFTTNAEITPQHDCGAGSTFNSQMKGGLSHAKPGKNLSSPSSRQQKASRTSMESRVSRFIDEGSEGSSTNELFRNSSGR